jgi:hypothetical protein
MTPIHIAGFFGLHVILPFCADELRSFSFPLTKQLGVWLESQPHITTPNDTSLMLGKTTGSLNLMHVVRSFADESQRFWRWLSPMLSLATLATPSGTGSANRMIELCQCRFRHHTLETDG